MPLRRKHVILSVLLVGFGFGGLSLLGARKPAPSHAAADLVFSFRRTVLVRPLEQNLTTLDSSLRIGGVRVQRLSAWVGLDRRYRQTWRLERVVEGKHGSSTTLAPGEEVTLELAVAQPTNFDRETLSSLAAFDRDESIKDNPVLDVLRAAIRNQGWDLDGEGAVTLDAPRLGAPDRDQQATLDEIMHAVELAAQQLLALQALQVRGVTETFKNNRMTRKIKNPYRHRTLTLDALPLQECFAVQTELSDTRPVLVLSFDGLDFASPESVLANSDFLREKIRDNTIAENFDDALAGAASVRKRPTSRKEAVALTHLKAHLLQRERQYAQEYLGFAASETRNHAIVALAARAIELLTAQGAIPPLLFAPERAFVDRDRIIVPTTMPLAQAARLAALEPLIAIPTPQPPRTEVVLPGDGIHLKATPGACLSGSWCQYFDLVW